MASTSREIRFRIDAIYHSDPDNPNPTTGVILTVVGGRAHCPCPEFEDGETYIVFADYQEAWNRFTLTRYSVVRAYNFFTRFIVQYHAMQCGVVTEEVIV